MDGQAVVEASEALAAELAGEGISHRYDYCSRYRLSRRLGVIYAIDNLTP